MLDPRTETQRVPEHWMPLARTDDLVMTEFESEVFLYDLGRHRAFTLNPTAALIWRHCDGTTPVHQLAQLRLTAATPPLGAAVVWLTLRQLERLHLLAPSAGLPAAAPRYSRLQLLRAGVVSGAALLPVVSMVTAPHAANAASSCAGQLCDDSTPCCPGSSCVGGICV
jgi:hypothetical protein